MNGGGRRGADDLEREVPGFVGAGDGDTGQLLVHDQLALGSLCLIKEHSDVADALALIVIAGVFHIDRVTADCDVEDLG